METVRVLPPALTGAREGSEEKYTAQEISTGAVASVTLTGAVEKSNVELVHARLCQIIAADYRGRAHAELTNGQRERNATELARAELWDDLGLRIEQAFRGVRQKISAKDYELCRWYQLTLLKQCLGAGIKQRSREVSALLALLGEAVAGRVENVVGIGQLQVGAYSAVRRA